MPAIPPWPAITIFSVPTNLPYSSVTGRVRRLYLSIILAHSSRLVSTETEIILGKIIEETGSSNGAVTNLVILKMPTKYSLLSTTSTLDTSSKSAKEKLRMYSVACSMVIDWLTLRNDVVIKPPAFLLS